MALKLLLITLVLNPVTNVEGDAFDAFDLNHDGHLDRSEYEQGLTKLESFLKQPLSAGPATTGNGSFSSPSITLPGISLQGFWEAFTSSVAMILATEVGDKTFFIAAVMSMKHDRFAVFSGAILALIVMTVLSTAMGFVLPQFIDRKFTHIFGGLLFLYFGIKLIYDSRKMEDGAVSEELEEVEEELLHQGSKKEDIEEGSQSSKKKSGSSFGSNSTKVQVMIQSFTLTFLAEWGDRSQIATIALGAAKNPIGVTVGCCIGHSLCTGVAVIGGRMLASRISEKTVSRFGGFLFILCALHSLFMES